MPAITNEDPSQWGDEEIFNEAIRIVSGEFPPLASLIGAFEVKGSCESCGALIVDVFDDETAFILGEGSIALMRLEKLVEKPIEINRATPQA